MAPYWTRQDPNALPYVSANGELLLLLNRFLYGLKQSPLKFKLHLSRTLIDVGYKQSINGECLFHKRTKSGFSYISSNSDDLLHCVSCKILGQEFKDTMIKTYHDIVYHKHASSYVVMSITRSTNLDQIYVSQFGLTNRVISDFLPDEFPQASSPASSHLFNNVSEGQIYDQSNTSLIMAMMYTAKTCQT